MTTTPSTTTARPQSTIKGLRTPHGTWRALHGAVAQASGTAACLVLAVVTAAPVLASVRALPTPAETTFIDRATLNATSPQVPGSDNPMQEKMLQKLRSAAQRDGALMRKPRSPPVSTTRSSGDLSPADAAWLLGLLALHGLAMPADPAQAQHWFERAQLLGHPLAPAGLAWCQLSGCVAAPNPSTAMHWIALVGRIDPGLAKYLEWHAAKALAPLAEPRSPSPHWYPGSVAPAAAIPPLQKLLTQAVRAGSAQASNELGLEFIASGDIEQAMAQFQSASAKSEAAAANANLLARRFHSDPDARIRSARYSAADWYVEAQRYHRGDGVPANYTEAVRLYQVAASSGDPQARKMLELIFSRPLQGGTIDVTWMQQLAGLHMGVNGSSASARPSAPPNGWQREPSPLYDLVPLQWRTTGHYPRR